MFPVMKAMGYANTSYSDTDFTIVGIVFGNLANFVKGNGMLVIVAVLFLIPIVYNIFFGKRKTVN